MPSPRRHNEEEASSLIAHAASQQTNGSSITAANPAAPAPPKTRASSPLSNSVAASGTAPLAPPFRRHLTAALCMVLVSIIWVGAGVLVQWIYKVYPRPLPFFLTWVCVSEFVVLLPIRYVAESKSRGASALRCGRPSAAPTDWRAAGRAALLVCPVWFLAQGSYNWGLLGTSVSTSTILSATSCVWTLLMSTLILRQEVFTWGKLAGVALTLAGAGMVSLDETRRLEDAAAAAAAPALDPGPLALPPPWGAIVCLFSALAYSIYTSLIRATVPDEGVSISVFFGWLGVSNSVLLAPVVAMLAYWGVEPLGDVSLAFIGVILVKGLFDNVFSDLLWTHAILLAGPTMATVGLSMTIPMALLSDALLAGLVPSLLLASGGVAVLCGFIMVTLAAAADGSPGGTAAAQRDIALAMATEAPTI